MLPPAPPPGEIDAAYYEACRLADKLGAIINAALADIKDALKRKGFTSVDEAQAVVESYGDRPQPLGGRAQQEWERYLAARNDLIAYHSLDSFRATIASFVVPYVPFAALPAIYTGLGLPLRAGKLGGASPLLAAANAMKGKSEGGRARARLIGADHAEWQRMADEIRAKSKTPLTKEAIAERIAPVVHRSPTTVRLIIK